MEGLLSTGPTPSIFYHLNDGVGAHNSKGSEFGHPFVLVVGNIEVVDFDIIVFNLLQYLKKKGFYVRLKSYLKGPTFFLKSANSSFVKQSDFPEVQECYWE